MKSFFKFLISGLILLSLIHFLWLSAAQGQTGTQSDVTGPDLQELPPDFDLVFPNLSPNNLQVNREAFERSFEIADFDLAVSLFEQLQALEYSQYLGLKLYGKPIRACEIAEELNQLYQRTGQKAALIYVVSLNQKLELLMVAPQAESCGLQHKNIDKKEFNRQVIEEANKAELLATATRFRTEISNPRRVNTTSYLNSAKKLHQWIIESLAPHLKSHQIDTLVFAVDRGLRSIPLAALTDGQSFLIENYNLALIPSYSLTDTRYSRINNARVLAFGVSESTQDLPPLPAVAVEVPEISKTWQGRDFLNQDSTIQALENQSREHRYSIIHIATHAEFKSGTPQDSYIQFWNERLDLNQLRKISLTSQWLNDPKVELLTLSACRTALGNEKAELGFAGLALQAGVKTAIGSLWYASDQGSLALMVEFYRQLKTATTKTEALRKAQLALLQKQVRIQGSQLELSNRQAVPLAPRFVVETDQPFSHPYFWSAYTMVGNWN